MARHIPRHILARRPRFTIGTGRESTLLCGIWRERRLGVPTYRLLGGAARERVLLYRHVRCDSIPNMVEHAHALIHEGYSVLRISPLDAFAPEGVFDAVRGLRGAIDYMAALREAVGPETQIIFEAHTRLNPPRP